MKTIVFPSRKEILGVEAVEPAEWATVDEDVVGSLSLGQPNSESTPDFLRDTLENVPAKYRQDMEALLTRYQDLFHDMPLKSTTVAEHEINTGNHQPIRTALIGLVT